MTKDFIHNNIFKILFSIFSFITLLFFVFFLFLVNANGLEFGVDYDSYYTINKYNELFPNYYESSQNYLSTDLIDDVLDFGFNYAATNNLTKNNYVLWYSNTPPQDYSTNGSSEIFFRLVLSNVDLYKFQVYSDNGNLAFSFNENNDFYSDINIYILYNTVTNNIYSYIPHNNNDVYIANHSPFMSIVSTNLTEIQFMSQGSSRNNLYVDLSDYTKGVISKGTTVNIDMFFNEIMLDTSKTTIDMSSANGILFYYKNWQETPPDTYIFTLNGSYEYTQLEITNSSLLLSNFDFIPIRNKKVPLNNAIDFEIDHCWSCMDNIYANNKNYQYGFYFKNLTINEIQTISYNSDVFDYRFINENGTISLPISFIDSEGNSNSIEYLPPLFINNNSLTTYFMYYTNFLNSIKIKSNVIWSYFSKFFNGLPTELYLIIMFAFIFILFLTLYKAFRD